MTPSDLQRELDAIFDEGRGARDAEPFLMGALAEAERVGDRAMMLTVQNELAGLYRAFSRHEEAVAAAESALALIDDLGADGSDVHATTLINAATAQRAAGDHDGALARYRRALAISESTMAPTDRRLAALHNNLSMVYSETGDDARARDELRAALAILEATTTEPDGDIDVATTLTNLGLVELSLGEGAEARVHLDEAVAALRRSGFQSNAHYASALAGAAQARFRGGEYPEAVDLYTEAAELLARIYGTDNDYYRVTAQNLDEAREAASVRGASAQPASPRGGDRRESAQPAPPAPPPEGATAEKAGPAPSGTMSGLELAREYWNAYGPALLERYPALRGRVAAGLVGHGSDCYGFDDDLSRDHDFGPGFCLWLTAEDYADHGAALQADYDALPEEFAGVGPRTTSPRATGTARRVGVFEIGGFYREITGYADAPDSLHEWLMLEEATLAAATNGAIFADPLGAFSKVRGDFKRMPKDVRLALISRRLGMMAQAGQYNVPRMLARGQGEAAWLAIGEFVRATASLVFLLNGPASVGYLPYYKWQFAALRRLSMRMASRLPGVVEQLSELVRLASAACLGGAGFGEGGKGSDPARERVVAGIEAICAQVAGELTARGLTRSDATFLEWQRPYVEEGIEADWLRTL